MAALIAGAGQGGTADKHGFELAGFRSFEKQVTQEYIEGVKRAAGRG